MITCERDGCEWRGFLSDLGEHEFVDHGIGNQIDCHRCGGVGEYLASRVPNWQGDEDWRPCRSCNGRGFIV